MTVRPGARLLEINALSPKLSESAEAWRWSSVRAHLAGQDDELVKVKPLIDRYGAFDRFCELNGGGTEEAAWATLRKAETTGRPVGTNEWLEELEARSGRILKPAKRGPKRKRGEFSKLSP